MTPEQIVEATLFASQSPLTPSELAQADESLDAARVEEALQSLRERYDDEDHAFQLYQLGDGYQLLTRPEYAPYLERFDSVPRPPALSRAALETLAIIAYRQPIGRLEIEEIRGVASTTVLRTLQDWELIGIVGRGEGLGRPLLYGTTGAFLDHFGLQGLDELPQPEDLSVALRGAEVVAVEESPDGQQQAEAASAEVGLAEQALAERALAEGAQTERAETEGAQTGEAQDEEAPDTGSSNGRPRDQEGTSGSGNGSRPPFRGSA
jgi:segregation and condensation protein B